MRIDGVQLFIFPHAGGSEVSYVPIEKEIRSFAVTSVICYAGRGRRVNEPFIKDMDTMAMDCMEMVNKKRNRQLPLIFLGHSLGSLVAFETMKCMRNNDIALPDLAFFSGRKAPAVNTGRNNRSLLSDTDLLACLSAMGGIPEYFLQYPDFLSFYLPIIRNDLSLNDTYCYKSSPQFDIPFVIMNGSEDENIGPDPVLSWKQHTSAACYQEWLDGNHFYFSDTAGFCQTLFKYISMYFTTTRIQQTSLLSI